MESIRKYQFLSTENLSLYAHFGSYVLYLHSYDDTKEPIMYQLSEDDNRRITIPSEVGWEKDTDDEEYDDRVTKTMRTQGFMKAPNSWTNSMGSSTSVRTFHYMSRRILVKAFLEPYQNYYIRFKSVLEDNDKEFFMDYFEYVAKEVYDNPEELEDIW